MNYVKFTFVFALLLFVGCKEPATAPPAAEYPNYFPVMEGSRFTYQVDSVTAGGNVPIGIRTSILQGETVLYGTAYRKQLDTLTTPLGRTGSASYVRATAAGVYYFYDNAPLKALIPDSLKPFVAFDEEAMVLSNPVTNGRQWFGYKVLAGTASFISLQANVVADDTLAQQVNGIMQRLFTKKIHYTMRVVLPPQLFPGAEPVEYSGDAWFAANIGVVKLRGNAALFALIGGGQVTGDAGQLVTEQRLTGYSIP